MNVAELYEIYKEYPSAQTDTRKLKKKDIFFALKGPNFNGNAFVKQALDDAAILAVIDEKEFEIPGKTFWVEDVITALQQLAKHRTLLKEIPLQAVMASGRVRTGIRPGTD